MSRAIHKMRGVLEIAVSIEDFGNINSTPGASATFAGVSVGSGSGRSIIIMATAEDQSGTTTQINSITVDGNACPIQVFQRATSVGVTICTAIAAKLLDTESGSVDIVVGCSESVDSFGMSFLIVTGMKSATAIDTAFGGSVASTTAFTDSTLDGLKGGIALGVAVAVTRTITQTWSSSLTERADVTTGGGGGDHNHGVGYDLLPNGRVAAVETVTFSSSDHVDLSTATFR